MILGISRLSLEWLIRAKVMNKKFYSDFVKHCVRYYLKYPTPHHTSEADRLNWQACKASLEQMSADDVEMITEVFSDFDIEKSIYHVSAKYRIRVDNVWKTVAKFEKTLAIERGLI